MKPLKLSEIPTRVFQKRETTPSIATLPDGTVLTITDCLESEQKNRKGESVPYWTVSTSAGPYRVARRLAEKVRTSLEYARALGYDSIQVTIKKDAKNRVALT